MKSTALHRLFLSSRTASSRGPVRRIVPHDRELGHEIFDLTSGYLDFEPPISVMAAIVKVLGMKGGDKKYLPLSGLEDLRHKMVFSLNNKGMQYFPENVLVSSSPRNALFNVLLAVLDHGDEVLINVPYRSSYPEQVKLAGGIPVFVPVSADFQPDVAAIEKNISPKTKVLILNTPNNPTGVIYSQGILSALTQLALKHDILIISDEVYEDFVYDACHMGMAPMTHMAKDRIIFIKGFSKNWTVPGWRIGFAIGPKAIISAASNIQSKISGDALSFSQLVAALILDKAYVKLPSPQMLRELRDRRNFVSDVLEKLPGISFRKPDGSLYFWIQVEGNAQEICEELVSQHHVALVSGKSFGQDSYLRLCYAVPKDCIEAAMERIEAYFNSR